MSTHRIFSDALAAWNDHELAFRRDIGPVYHSRILVNDESFSSGHIVPCPWLKMFIRARDFAQREIGLLAIVNAAWERIRLQYHEASQVSFELMALNFNWPLTIVQMPNRHLYRVTSRYEIALADTCVKGISEYEQFEALALSGRSWRGLRATGNA